MESCAHATVASIHHFSCAILEFFDPGALSCSGVPLMRAAFRSLGSQANPRALMAPRSKRFPSGWMGVFRQMSPRRPRILFSNPCLIRAQSQQPSLPRFQAKFRWERPGGPAASFDLDLSPSNGVLRGKEVSLAATPPSERSRNAPGEEIRKWQSLNVSCRACTCASNLGWPVWSARRSPIRPMEQEAV